jgi:anti-sigma28 factor (negative regulator of flagellin synthesis)
VHRREFPNKEGHGTKVVGTCADELVEHGGSELIYMNGIGSSQRLPGVESSIAPSDASKVVGSNPGTSGATQQSAAGSEAATANLSASAGSLANILSGSDVRTGLVTALSASIGAGTYNVPASSVAGKMLSALLN